MKNVSFIKMLNLGAIIVGVLFALLNIFHYAGEPTLGADIVSRVLPAVGHRIGLGVAYKDFWEITPPGHYIVLDIWAQFFGFSGLSIKMLHLVTSLLLVFSIYYVLSKVLKGSYLFVSASVIYFFLFSVRLTTFILPAEILALLFSILGLASLYYFKNYKRAIFISTFLFFFSGQVKDPYLFSFTAVLPYILFLLLKSKKDFYRGLASAFFGVLSSTLLCIVYLLILGNFTDYLSILTYKSDAFEIFNTTWLFNNFLIHVNFVKDVFFYFRYSLILPLIIFGIVKIYSKIKNRSLVFRILNTKKNSSVKSTLSWQLKDHTLWTTTFYILGLFVGFVIQRSLGSHYYIVAIVPLIFTVSLPFMYADKEAMNFKKYGLLARIFLFIVFLLLLFPKKAYFSDYQFKRVSELRFLPKLAIWANKNLGIDMLNKIDSNTKKDDCILDIYGWGVGTTYLYAQRRPCTRFFIANIVNQDWQRQEYKNSILSNNPMAIIYNPSAGDIDYKHFEDTVANFTKVLKHCYVQDQNYKTLYWPKLNGENLGNCIASNISS